MKASRIFPIAVLVFSFLGSTSIFAQDRDSNNTPDYNTPDYNPRTRAVEEPDSRAEKEAERLVSLPPERIVLLLQQEPGLFLEVKKMLVRRAYSQGRVVEEKELTDTAIFRLIRDDEEVRSLVTQQIVDRGYVRAKPTREELAREVEEQQKLGKPNDREQPYPYRRSENEAPEEGGPGVTQRGSSQPSLPYTPNMPTQETPTPAQPQNQISPDQRRALLQASMNGASEETGGLPFDAVTGGNTQLTPEQVQQLMSQYGGKQLPNTGGMQSPLGSLAIFLRTTLAAG